VPRLDQLLLSYAAQERGYKKESAGSRCVSESAVQFNCFREELTPNERDEAARLPPGHQPSTYATEVTNETAPERSRETADEHGYRGETYVADEHQ
jgi:hypothetical protein